jgi:TolB protein
VALAIIRTGRTYERRDNNIRDPMPRLLQRTLLFAAFLCAAVAARAQLTIDIVGGAGTTIPISIVPFDADAGGPAAVSSVVAADLARSGLFKLVDGSMVSPRPVSASQVRTGDWRARGADAVAVGSVRAMPDGRVDVRFDLVDAVKQQTIASQSYLIASNQRRATAHKIADVIYEKLTGDKGVFSTRIAYVTKQGPRYQLVVADADGADPQVVVSSNEPILSPRWSPEGNRLAYVSLEQKKPIVYVQNLSTGGRLAVANFRGSNSSPAWSPDGRNLAVTLTREGGSQLFIIDANGGNVRRVMSSPGIDTEAWYMPDGQSLLFTSDRGGSPQIYKINIASGSIERLTFDGNYNVSPRALPDGKGMVYVRRDGGRFTIAIMDFATRQTQTLTQGPDDESPSVAPNGRMILYANESGGGGTLAAVSSDGRVKQRLSAALNVREPAWGPLPP